MNTYVCITLLVSADGTGPSAVSGSFYAVVSVRVGVRWKGLAGDGAHDCRTRVTKHVSFLFQTFPFFLQSYTDSFTFIVLHTKASADSNGPVTAGRTTRLGCNTVRGHVVRL